MIANITDKLSISNQEFREKRSHGLHSCLDSFTNNEVLDNENTWYCSKCKDHKLAEKQILVHKLPNYLIIHLKRFSASTSHISKNIALVDFPIKGLDMRPYMVNPESSKDTVYDLYGVINHMGGLSGGHYTAFVESVIQKDFWVHYDDESIDKLRESDIISKAAYVLFYKRRT